MPRTLIKSKLHSNKNKPKIKQEPDKSKSILTPNLQSFKQKLLSGNGFVEYKYFYILYMSLEDFQLLDNEVFAISIVKRDFMKVYHQQGAQLNVPDQNTEFSFGENNNYHQIGNAYLEYVITVQHPFQNPPVVFDNDSRIRLTKNGLAYVFQEAVLATTSSSNLEHNKYVGQISTIMRVLTSKDGDLISQFDNINEGNTDDDFDSTSLKKISLIIMKMMVIEGR